MSKDPDENKEAKFEESAPEESFDSEVNGLLGEVLRQTQESQERDELFKLLVKFCSIHADRHEMTEELMEDIVKMILTHRFPNDELPYGCSQWIAEILFHDPASRERVETVWQQALDQVS